MPEILEAHEKLVLEEDRLVKRISTLERIISVILNLIYKEGDSLDLKTIEESINSLHTVLQDLNTELLHVRLEKSLVTHKHDFI